MIKLEGIGNLTRDPELRTVKTANGDVNVCSFSLACTDRSGAEPKTVFVNVSAWRGLGETIHKYCHKGSKLWISGNVNARAYQANDGSARASLDVTLASMELLSSGAATPAAAPEAAGFSAVDTEELPF